MLRKRNRLAVVAAAVVFFVLAGTGVAAAYWSTHANVVSTVTAGVVGTAPNCSAMTTLVNGSFESPAIPAGTWARSIVTGWSTGDPAGVELWNNFDGFAAANGAQHAEINGNFADTLSQVFTTTPGQTLTWSLMHRGRAGVDTMAVAFGPSAGAGVVVATFSDGNAAWGLHSGTYVVPAGQTITKISLTATGSAGGDLSYGNFVDDVKVNNGPCLNATPVATNVTRGGSTHYTGDEIRYTTTIQNMGGSSALSASFSPVIPTGATYKPGSLTVAGVARTDAVDGDVGSFGTPANTVRAFLGTGATSSAGGTLLSGASVTVVFSVIITSTAASGSLSFSTVATFADPMAPTWPITASPVTIGTSFTRGSDLGVVVLATPAPVTGSATASSWTFTLTNNGPNNATDASVLVTVPTGLTVTAATFSPAGTCTGSGTTRTCAVGALNAGQSRTITLTGTVASTYSTSTMAVTATASSTSVDANAVNNAVTNTATVTDGTNPTTPGTPVESATTSTGVTLTWTGSTDNFAVTGYNVYRDAVLITTVATLTYTDSGLTAATTYSYTIRARDAAGNLSTASGAESVTTLVLPPNGTSYYAVASANSGRCMQGTATTNQNITLVATCTQANTRDWRFVPTTGGYVKVNELVPNTLVWNNSNPNFRNVTSAAVTAQEWLLTQYGNSFQIQSRNVPTQCVARTGTGTVGVVNCVTIGTDSNQLWVFTVRP